jgi:hypothetical protein
MRIKEIVCQRRHNARTSSNAILSMLYNINLQALLYTTPLFTDIENDIINDMVCKYLANTGSVKVW